MEFLLGEQRFSLSVCLDKQLVFNHTLLEDIWNQSQLYGSFVPSIHSQSASTLLRMVAFHRPSR